MKLFERVKHAAVEVAGSRAKLAEMLGIPQPTFHGYLNEIRQDNLWPLLPRILEVLPQISREWLYFGEGDMLRAAALGARGDDLDETLLCEVIATLEEVLVELGKTLAPEKKAKAVCLLYHDLRSENTIHRKPATILQFIRKAVD